MSDDAPLDAQRSAAESTEPQNAERCYRRFRRCLDRAAAGKGSEDNMKWKRLAEKHLDEVIELGGHKVENDEFVSALRAASDLEERCIVRELSRNAFLTEDVGAFRAPVRHAAPARAAPATMAGAPEGECVVCFEAAPLATLVPCGHTRTCAACVAALLAPACPVCRAPIEGTMRVIL